MNASVTEHRVYFFDSGFDGPILRGEAVRESIAVDESDGKRKPDKEADLKEPADVRQNFVETWIFTDLAARY